MLLRLKRLVRLYKFLKTSDDICNQKLTPEDVNNIAALYVDDKYKSLVKLYDNIIINLENKGFREMQVLEEFMGVKWTRQTLEVLKAEVKNKYLASIKTTNAKTTPKPEDLESFPDGTPIQA